MNSLIDQYVIIGGTCLVVGYVLAKYDQTLAFIAFNALVDAKIAIFGIPKVSTTTYSPNATECKGDFIFNHYYDSNGQTKFTQWFPCSEQGRVDAKNTNIKHIDADPIKFVFVTQPSFNTELKQIILDQLSKLAGPEGDFDDNIPSLATLSALIGINLTTSICVESENYETFTIT